VIAMTDTLPHELVEIHAGANPDAPAVIFADDSLSYSELDRRANEVARTLLDAGVRAGSVVPLVATLTLKTVISLVAIPRLGAVPAPFGPHRIDVTEATADTAYAIVSTSGSSGHPRGVVLTASNVTAAVEASRRRLGNDSDDRWLLTLPLFHVGGLSVVWRSLSAGGSIELHGRFDATTAATSLKRRSVSMASLVPTMLHRILEADPGPYEGIKGVLLGGAPATRDLVGRGLTAGLPVLQTYGMTETCSQVATVEPGRERESLGTAGRLLDGFVASFDEGEILLDGPAVSPGYFGDEQRVGPYRTGDLGHLDTEGRLVVTGRRDALILTGGENVRPSVVEAAIESVPTVAIAVVVGVDDGEWGQVVVALVETDDRHIPGIEAAVAGRLARHEIPKRWIAVDSIPLLPNGKPDRAAARDLAATVLSTGC
jgi:O-succinylbenzoic acid--CoA ligase